MGTASSRSFLCGKKKARIVMLGLDYAGKSTILYKLKNFEEENIMVIPTTNFNMETIEIGSVIFTIWDVGGQWGLRRIWTHYFRNEHTHALIFVVDSCDSEKIDQAKEELDKLLEDEHIQNCLLLVFANKQGEPKSLSVDQVSAALKLKERRNHWHIQPSNGLTGKGLIEGMQWISDHL